MNKLPLDKRAQILSMLCEGSSMRSIGRVVFEDQPIPIPFIDRPVNRRNFGDEFGGIRSGFFV